MRSISCSSTPASPTAPWISVEALLAPIIGGIGTVFGPLLGALVVQGAGRSHQAPDRRRARASISSSMAACWCSSSRSRRAASRACSTAARATPPSERGAPRGCLLRSNASRKRFGGLLAVDDASFSARAKAASPALIGPNGAGKTTLFAIIAGFLRADRRPRRLRGRRHHRPRRRIVLARRGIARTFQIVQPFAGLTVRENIAVGAHLPTPRRARTRCAAPSEVAQAGRP